MRRARIAGLTALVLSVTAGLPMSAAFGAGQADAGTLHVNNVASANCSDTAPGSGSAAVPFCTISAAAKVVTPGQTVQIAGGRYVEEIHLTRSGEPGAPITFTGPAAPVSRDTGPLSINDYGGAAHALVLDGVHDVNVKHFDARGAQEAVLVKDSSRVTVDDATVWSSGWGDNSRTTSYAGIRITGQSADVTVSRSVVSGSHGDGLIVDPGVARTVITTNEIAASQGRGLVVTDAPGTVITSNTVGRDCSPAVSLEGNSSGSTIENNVLKEDENQAGPWGSCPSTGRVDLSVSAASVPGTKAAYNVVATSTRTPYVWADQTYADVASFQAATGQGAHDLSGDLASLHLVSEGSPVIDSADAEAPGELDTMRDGKLRVDDPLVANSGTGAGYHDRGAFEFQDPGMTASVSAAPKGDGYPFTMTVTGSVSSPWSPAKTSVDFGDGTAPVTTAQLQLDHTYPGPGNYTITLTATNSLGTTRTATQAVAISAPGPIQPALTLTRDKGNPLLVAADAAGTKSPWPVASYSYDFGDGTAPVVGAGTTATHTYAADGTYTVTETVKDDKGRTASVSHRITVGSAYVALQPTRVLDTRNGTGAPTGGVGPGGVVKLQVTGRGGVPANAKVTAVLLNLTATEPTADSFVTAYPTGTARPTASSLNFTAGQTVANAAVVPVGKDGTISLYNRSGKAQLVADVQGYYTDEMPAQGTGTYIGVWAPTRVLDTRQGIGLPQGKLGPGTTVSFKVRGEGGLPDWARSVVLNLTATEASEGGYLTAAPNGTPPTNSSLNFAAGRTVANQVTVPIEPDGTVRLFNHNGTVHVIADVQAYYGDNMWATNPFLTTTPTRVLDTRAGSGGQIGPGGSVRVKVHGVAGVPDTARAVLVNVTATGPSAGGFLTAYASGDKRPATSVVNFTPGATVPNLAWVPIGYDGCIEIYNHSGSVDAVVDLQGFEAGESWRG